MVSFGACRFPECLDGGGDCFRSVVLEPVKRGADMPERVHQHDAVGVNEAPGDEMFKLG